MLNLFMGVLIHWKPTIVQRPEVAHLTIRWSTWNSVQLKPAIYEPQKKPNRSEYATFSLRMHIKSMLQLISWLITLGLVVQALAKTAKVQSDYIHDTFG